MGHADGRTDTTLPTSGALNKEHIVQISYALRQKQSKDVLLLFRRSCNTSHCYVFMLVILVIGLYSS